MPDQTDDTDERRWWLLLCNWSLKLIISIWTLIIIAILDSALVAYFFLPLDADPSKYKIKLLLDWFQTYPIILFPAGVFLLLNLSLVSIRLRQRMTKTSPEPVSNRPSMSKSRFQLWNILADVYQLALQRSLPNMKSIELRFLNTFDAIAHPMQLVAYPFREESEELSSGTRIFHIYEDAKNGLLLLGGPGAGKSTLLLELALSLSERVGRDPTQPLPVIVSLSSWKVKKTTFQMWLVEEIAKQYGRSHSQISSLLMGNQLLPFLDGLDEVPESIRSSCIEKINLYQQENSLPLVVCCRKDAYFSQKNRLQLQRAITIQPLTKTLLDTYLDDQGPRLTILKKALDKNAALQSLTTTPLMLRVLIQIYQARPAWTFSQSGTKEEQQRQIFDLYVMSILEQQTRTWHYTPQKVQQFLIYIAHQMQAHDCYEFFVEQLDHSWLPTDHLFDRKPWLLGLVLGLIITVIGVGVGALIGILVGIPMDGLLGGLMAGCCLGVSGAYGMSEQEVMSAWYGKSFVIIQLKSYKAIFTSRWFALILGIVCEIIIWLNVQIDQKVFWGIFVGLGIALIFGGFTYLYNCIIRFSLWRNGTMPLRLVRFLTEAVDHTLLQHVEGSYRFFHSLFQDYFASK